jgi:hypothetical protein
MGRSSCWKCGTSGPSGHCERFTYAQKCCACKWDQDYCDCTRGREAEEQAEKERLEEIAREERAALTCPADGKTHNWRQASRSTLFCTKCAQSKSLGGGRGGGSDSEDLSYDALLSTLSAFDVHSDDSDDDAIAGSGRLEPTRVPCAGHKLHDPSCSNCRKEAINYPDSDPSKVACPRHKLHDRRCSDCMECHAEGTRYKLIPSHKACSVTRNMTQIVFNVD